MTTAQTVQLREDAFPDGTLKIDTDAAVIYGVKILGRESLNGRVYSQTALEQAAKLYDGIAVNLDHPVDPRSVRSVSEGWGVLRNTRVARDGVYGDLHYLKNHAQTPALIERAQRFPRNFGLSHNASGTVVATPDGPDIVESIEHVESVDLVSKPATNRGLFESQEEPTMPQKYKVKQLLERAKGTEPRRLCRLLEMDEFSMMADTPVEVAPEATPEDQLQASIESLILAVLRDNTLDAPAKIAKMRKILNVQDQLAPANNGGAGNSGAGDSGDAGGSGEVSEALVNRLARIERREQMRDILESAGLTLSDLSRAQRKLLERCQTEDEMEELVETFKEAISVSPASTVEFRPRKPAARSIVESDHSVARSRSYDDLLREAKAAR